MTAPTLPDRHLRSAPAPRSEAPPIGLSTAGWSRLRRSVTAAVFVIATVTGVTIGVHAIDVSPVAPPVAVGQLAPPVVASPTAPALTQPATPSVIPPTAPLGTGAGPGGIDELKHGSGEVAGRGGGRIGGGAGGSHDDGGRR